MRVIVTLNMVKKALTLTQRLRQVRDNVGDHEHREVKKALLRKKIVRSAPRTDVRGFTKRSEGERAENIREAERS